MSRALHISGVVAACGTALVCALLIRDGLMQVARSIDEKSLQGVEASIEIDQLRVNQASVQAHGSESGDGGTPQVNVTIESLDIEANASSAAPRQPVRLETATTTQPIDW